MRFALLRAMGLCGNSSLALSKLARASRSRP